MLRQTIVSLRLLVDLFRDLPPLPRHVLLPGMIAVISYPLLSVLLDDGLQGQAFVTAFVLALALRIVLRFDGIVATLLHRFGRGQAVVIALMIGLGPVGLLVSAGDPLWCQRAQSVYYILFGSVFLSDMIAGRNDMALRLWPWEGMAAHLSAMTRIMVLFNLGLLLLNEAMIVSVDPSHWLLFWAALPVIGHLVLSAMIALGLHRGDDAALS